MADPIQNEHEINLNQTASEDEILEFMGDDQKTETTTTAPTGVESTEGGTAGDDDDDLEEGGVKVSQAELEAGTDAEKEAAKAKRLNQRQRLKQRNEQLERQLANVLASNQQIQQRIAQLENSNLGTQAAHLDRAMQEADQAETNAKNILADASVKGDGTRVVEATDALMKIQRYKDGVIAAKQQFEQQTRQPRSQPLDSELVNNAKNFMVKHSWYRGPKSQDLDSQILSVIDNNLTAEGWDPRSPSYWTELENRASKRLPERFGVENTVTPPGNGSYNPATTRPTPKSPVAGGSNSSQNDGGKRDSKYTLSAERVKAMKEAGFWDDEKKRESMIKRYKEQDRQSQSAR